MRTVLHYIVTLCVLSIYGMQVCPFLDTLQPAALILDIGFFLILAHILRLALHPLVVERGQPFARSKRQFLFDLTLFGCAGIGMMVFNFIYFGFPLGSGIKLVVGSVAMGLFASMDLALAKAYDEAIYAEQHNDLFADFEQFLPLPRKFTIMASAITVLVGGILVLVILHDLHWVRMLPPEASLAPAVRSVIIEISFVLAILLCSIINLIMSYARNLKLYFSRQTRVLIQVSQGHFDGFVPVTTNDEFGLIGQYTNQMITGLRERTEALQKTQDVTIRTLASLAETRDNETGMHILRTQYYVRVLADELSQLAEYRDELNEETIDLLFKSAPLHDVGKVGIPDHILLKPGKLTDEEFEVMKNHALYGRDSLQVAEADLGSNSFLRYASEIAYTHHEKWDGTGYPEGLSGPAIPLSGRLMALADVYDALISKRIYKPAFSHDKAYGIIMEGRGNHFDPDVVGAFIRREDDFKRIAAEHSDASPE